MQEPSLGEHLIKGLVSSIGIILACPLLKREINFNAGSEEYYHKVSENANTHDHTDHNSQSSKVRQRKRHTKRADKRAHKRDNHKVQGLGAEDVFLGVKKSSESLFTLLLTEITLALLLKTVVERALHGKLVKILNSEALKHREGLTAKPIRLLILLYLMAI